MTMMGFEYGIYSPGDKARIKGEIEPRTIEAYSSEIVYFSDGSSIRTEDVEAVIIES